MFTGIVSALGSVVDVRPLGAASGHGKRLAIGVPRAWLDDVGAGDSIALNGACMTVVGLDRGADRFDVDISVESLACTAGLDARGPINLEKAMRPSDRLGGHLVSGHVDGVGVVTRFRTVGESTELRVEAPGDLARFLACKGSITVNGVSLTVNAVEDLPHGCAFTVNLIPHTLRHTTLGTLAAGTRVNLEIDLIARYVERMLTGAGPRR